MSRAKGEFGDNEVFYRFLPLHYTLLDSGVGSLRVPLLNTGDNRK